MLKVIFISSFLFITLLSCQNANSIEPINYEKDTPQWLKVKIDSMSTNPDYFGTKVYRCEWNSKFTYHIMIPISSCAYCEVYEQNGNKIQFTNDETFSDFIKNKNDEILVWEKKD